MNFNLSEEHLMIRDAARDFAQTELLPGVIERDEKQEFPAEQIKKLGELGFMGMMVSPENGGSGMDTLSYVLAMEELSKIDASASVVVSVNNSLVCWGLETFGSAEQKAKYLTRLASGEIIGSFCLSEPEAGSDATSQATTAVDMGDHYLLNGTKNWITNGGTCEIALVIAQTDREKGHRGINALIVEKGMEGFVVGKKEDKLGMRASETAELIFDQCRVHKDNMLGSEGEGFVQSLKLLDGGRISIGALSLGIAKGAYEAALKYSKERVQFGKPISSFQGVSFKLSDMATEIQASELLVHKAASMKNKGEKVTTTGAMAKMYSSEACVRIANEAVQIHGGYGYIKEYPVEKFYRDSKLCTIGEGTTEIQKLVIARNILK